MTRRIAKVLEIASLHDDCSDTAFWLKKSPRSRLLAMERLRRVNFGYGSRVQRMARVIEVVARKGVLQGAGNSAH